MKTNDIIAVFFLMAVLWPSVIVAISFVTGWRDLARHYRYKGQPLQKKAYMQSASMRTRWMGYHNCLTVGKGPEGLYIGVFFLFRLAHPPLFVPWQDISVKKSHWLGFPLIELTFAKAPKVPVILPGSLQRFISAGS